MSNRAHVLVHSIPRVFLVASVARICEVGQEFEDAHQGRNAVRSIVCQCNTLLLPSHLQKRTGLTSLALPFRFNGARGGRLGVRFVFVRDLAQAIAVLGRVRTAAAAKSGSALRLKCVAMRRGWDTHLVDLPARDTAVVGRAQLREQQDVQMNREAERGIWLPCAALERVTRC